jgi:thermitase
MTGYRNAVTSVLLGTASLLISASGAMAGMKSEVIPGEFLVKLKRSGLGLMDTTHRNAFLAQFSHELDIEGAKLVRAIPGTEILVVKSDAPLPLQQLPEVEAIEPNLTIYIDQTPNDPSYSDLWGMKAIGAEAAWDIETGTADLSSMAPAANADKKIVVAVIDTGITLDHPDLKDNLWTNPAEASANGGKSGVDDDRDGYVDDVNGYDFYNRRSQPLDDHGHGSHVSGTIGAKGNNSVGVAGVNWNVRIMALKTFNAAGMTKLDLAVEAVKYATAHGARVINASWGGSQPSDILKEAIADAGKKNVLFVAAAGNDGENNDSTAHYPANYNLPNLISVAAIDETGALADFSDYGKKTVHIAAPGDGILSTIRDGKYGRKSGTSMATPHVVGVAALVLAHEPNLSAVQLKDRLLATAVRSEKLRDRVVSRGVVNAQYALLGRPAPLPESDAEGWELRKPLEISTAHPYNKDAYQTWTVTVPGAKRIALYFSRFDLYNPYDRVKLARPGSFDDSFLSLSGEDGQGWTKPIEGDTVQVLFTGGGRDFGKYGFDLTQVAYQ